MILLCVLPFLFCSLTFLFYISLIVLDGEADTLQIPGGGFGIFNGCQTEWGTPSTGWYVHSLILIPNSILSSCQILTSCRKNTLLTSFFLKLTLNNHNRGAQYGGISTRSQCDAFPKALQAGCYWRFDWFGNADNPTVSFKQVACPAALTAKTGCVRANDVIDETPTGPGSVPTWTSGADVPTSTVASSSSKSSSSKSSSSTKIVVTTSTSLSSSKSTVAPTSTKVGTSTTTSSAPASSDTLPPVARWGQCGGSTYYGSKTCVAPWVCTYNSPYYSQCL